MTKTPLNAADELKYWEANDPNQVSAPLESDQQFTQLQPSTKIITLRVPQHLLDNLKLIANKRDVPYQSLLKIFLQEKVNESMQTPFTQFKRKTMKRVGTAILALALVSGFTYSQFASPIKAVGNSMAESYPDGSYQVLDKISYKLSQPSRGDVVVFYSPTQPSALFFKRIVGLPSETISIANGSVFVNGQALAEPYATAPTVAGAFPKEGETITVPGNSYYVLGDNRDGSTDSRAFGFLPRESILGKVGVCYWNCK